MAALRLVALKAGDDVEDDGEDYDDKDDEDWYDEANGT